jgi:hypothetical protein
VGQLKHERAERRDLEFFMDILVKYTFAPHHSLVLASAVVTNLFYLSFISTRHNTPRTHARTHARTR